MGDETLAELLKQIEDKFGIKISIDDEQPPLLPTAEFVEFIRRKVGLPLTLSRVAKDAMTGRLPRPDVYYGRCGMRTPATALRYTIGLLTSEPVRLVGSRAGRLDVEADRGA